MITKIGLNRYRILISARVDGEIVKKQVTIHGNKTDADERYLALIREIKNIPGSSLKVFSEALELYRVKRNKHSGPDLSRLTMLKRDLGGIPLKDFADRFEQYLNLLRVSPCKKTGKPLSHAGINRLVEMVRAAFNLLLMLTHIERNPITKARFPKFEEKPRDRYLSEQERLRLLNVIEADFPYLLPLIRYSLLVPCRKSELIGLAKENYNAFTNTIYVPDSKAGIPIHKPVPDELKEYFRSLPVDCPYLFYRQDKDGKYHPIGDFKKAWKSIKKKAGISNFRFHDTRHISASDLYSNGNTERSIMDIAGWKTPMLSTYRHKDGLRSAMNIKFIPQAETPETSTKLPHFAENIAAHL
jgi:integrase